MERESFVFYRSWYEAIKSFPAEVQGEIYTAIIEYGLYGNETHDMGKITSAIFALVRPQIDSNIARYENGCKGGRPKNETKTKPNDNQNETKTKPNDNVNDNDLKKDNSSELSKKENFFETRKQEFYNQCADFVKQYGKETIREFFDYWTEPNKSKTKMRFELEKTWDLSRRLSTWNRNGFNFSKNGKSEQKDNNITV